MKLGIDFLELESSMKMDWTGVSLDSKALLYFFVDRVAVVRIRIPVIYGLSDPVLFSPDPTCNGYIKFFLSKYKPE